MRTTLLNFNRSGTSCPDLGYSKIMKNSITACIILFSITVGFGQNYDDHFDYKKSDLTALIVESQPLDTISQVEKVVIDGFNSKIPFYHILNKGTSEKKYAILLHGLGGNKKYWIYPSMPYLQYTKNLTAIKDSLLNQGFSLVIIDAKYHGERIYELNFRDPSYLPPQRSQSIEDANIFYDMMVSTVKEIRLIMDYLEDVHQSTDMKFNLIGYSMGGSISLLINSIDDRIKSVVACVPPMGRPYTELADFDWEKDIKEKMKSISPLYVATDQKSPVALLMGKTDFFIPEQEARNFFADITIEDKILKFYDSGHELPDEYVGDVINWITKHNKK